MDILFVHPNASHKLYQKLHIDYSGIEPPIWAGMLANHCRKKAKVSILDCEANRYTLKQSVDTIKYLNPKLICFVVYGQEPSASARNMQGVRDLLEELDGEFKTILVGLYPSAVSRKTMEDEKTNFVCQGEGPYTLDALIDVDMDDLSQLKQVPGLWYRDGKEILCNPMAPLISQNRLEHDLPGVAWDLLPPLHMYRNTAHFSMTNNNKRTPFVSLYTSLGCPYKCNFCCINAPFGNNNVENSTLGSSFRYWRPEFMIKQFDNFAKWGVRNIKIADEMFVLNPSHFLRLCEMIKEREYDFNIWAYARVNTVKDEYLETLKSAGINWLALGIESGNRNVRLEETKGKFSEVDIKEVVRKIEHNDIEVISNYMFGLTTDTMETMQETLDLAIELNTSWVNFNPNMAFPGSTTYLQALSEGWDLPTKYSEWSYYSYDSKPLDNKNLTRGQIISFRDEAFKKYHNRKEWFEKIERKFGQNTVDIFKDQLKINLKRKYVS
tara:strand:- start:302 stop:1786 length:1485 start_codon:yes stop_codon:yes gene_type:complete